MIQFDVESDIATSLSDGAEEVVVDRINQFAFFELGKKVQAVLSAAENSTGFNAWSSLMIAGAALRSLVSGHPVPLGVSKLKAETLAKAIDKMVKDHFTSEDGSIKFEPDPKVESWHWASLRSAATAFETVFSEEMREADTYRVPSRGIYSTSKLINAADETFPNELLPMVPEKTREDWRAAGRCLAFNLLSASGFHVARAVEGTIESYYQMSFGLTASDKRGTLKSWGEYLKMLEDARTSPVAKGALVPTEKVISELRQMKDDYRNPIAHPRIVLAEADARMLFANGESVIIAMAQEIWEATQRASLTNAPVQGLRLGA